jgi:hypothetical protein
MIAQPRVRMEGWRQRRLGLREQSGKRRMKKKEEKERRKKEK